MTDANSTIHAQTFIFAVVCVSETYPMPWAENLPPRRPEPPVNIHTCFALHYREKKHLNNIESSDAQNTKGREDLPGLMGFASNIF